LSTEDEQNPPHASDAIPKDGNPAWETTLRPLKGWSLGSIYVGKPPPKRKAKGGKKWVPPKVPMTAPKSCRDSGFSKTTCFECIRPTCIFDDQVERINKKRRPTLTQRRAAEAKAATEEVVDKQA
jgi:hypothetical protein